MRYKVKLEMGNVGEYLPTTKYKVVLTDRNFRITEYKKANIDEAPTYGFAKEYFYSPNLYFAKTKTYHVIKNYKRNADFNNDELLYHALYYIIQQYGYEALRDIPAWAIPLSRSEDFFKHCDEKFEESKKFRLEIVEDKLSEGKLQNFKRKLELEYAIMRNEKEIVVEYMYQSDSSSRKFKEYFDRHFYNGKLVDEAETQEDNQESQEEK